MSKISKENKLSKKQKKALNKSNSEKSENVVDNKKSSILNYGKCCTCGSFPKKVCGCTQVCRVSKKYVARKAEHPECYHCKY